MVIKNSLRWRMLLCVMASTAVAFLFIFGSMYLFSSKMIVKDIEQIGRKEVKLYADQIESVLSRVEQSAFFTARLVEQSPHDKEYVLKVLRTVIISNNDIFGGTVAYEPFAFNSDEKFFAPYYFKEGNDLDFLEIGRDSYDYFKWDWYIVPKKENKAVWTKPYFDDGAGNVLMATYSQPFYSDLDKHKDFLGVVTADISLTWLQDLLASIVVKKTGYAFMITKGDGQIIAHPNKKLIMNKTIFDLATEQNDIQLKNIADKMMISENGFFPYEEKKTGKKYWVAYSSFVKAPARICIMYPEKEVMAEIHRFNVKVITIAVLGGILLFLVVFSISASIIKPISELARTTEKIANGDLDAEVPHSKIKDEIEFLANSFENMKLSLKDYIQKITDTTIREEKAASELRVAHDIQMSLLPKVFPPFPEDKRFDVFAFMQPAKEVGGDLYDFFYITDDKVCFVIGDVSGKGVPASLFMAVTKTLIKVIARSESSPSVIFQRVNEELVAENTNFLFVTAFLGIMDLNTGEVLYSNAGHNPPFIINEDGIITECTGSGGMVLGIEEQAKYTDSSFILNKNERFFLFTDGVTEAMDGNGGFFGEEKIVEKLKDSKKLSIKEIIYAVLKDIEDFSKNTSQSDDITMMCFEYRAKE